MRIGASLYCWIVVLSVVAFAMPAAVFASPPEEARIALADLPPGFEAATYEDAGPGSVAEFDTLADFRFIDAGNAHALWGKTIRLSPGEKRLATLLLDNPASVLQFFPADPDFEPGSTPTAALDYAPIGDKSLAVTLHLSSEEQVGMRPEYGPMKRTDVVTFLYDDVMAMVALSYPVFNSPDFTLEEIATLLEKRMSGEAPASMPQPAPTQPPTPEPTAPPTPTALPSPTPTLASVPEDEGAVALAELKLRGGPGVMHDQIATLKSGDKLEIIGQSSQCAWLQVKLTDGGIGWVVGSPDGVRYDRACDAIPSGDIRPKTGTMERYFSTAGAGKLRVDNGTDHDGLVIVTDGSDKVLLSGYVRSGVTFTLSGIPDGSYRVYYAVGDGWDEASKMFTNTVELGQFDGTFDFRSTRDRYIKHDITLHAVAGGEGVVRLVSPGEFPELE